ncbi:hypothetical protein EXU85_32585 [Spirosoma sp. KCTC 42546]|uniref:hypothetical protein n=1 Tax=Spirosoma sp. KCTC 42546 TaxID=2520506 RepID=UPI001159D881|nr:hypothetical protein [Spirosoma sp. KCTC 42546]QDK83085.1 hypothetical protein EXU85_32585 [Spirosoma sp. KCTC 42546]
MSATQSVIILIFNTILTLGLTIGLLFLYKKKKLNIVEVVLISYSTQGYSLGYIGPTITAFFLISFYFFFEVIFLISFRPLVVRKKHLLLLLLPALSSIWAIGYYIVSERSFYYIPNSLAYFFTKPLFFYVKNFLPYFTLAYKFYLDRDKISLAGTYELIKKIAIFSCYFALAQLVICIVTKSPFLTEMIGNKSGYMFQFPNGIVFVRVSALFMEPKYLSAFLGLSLPLFMSSREYKKVALTIFVGVLTMSQTFTVECLIAVIVFLVFNNIEQVRVIIIAGITTIILFFMTFSAIKEIIINLAVEYKGNIAFTLLAQRAIGRYDGSLIAIPKAEILGLPFQYDLELPVVLFLLDHPVVFFTGYGPGNSNFLPPVYFEDLPYYEKQLSGTRANHMNMRWVFFISEFGVIIFICFFWVLTSVKAKRSTVLFYSYLWLCLFFNEVEVVIILFYVLMSYKNSKEEGLVTDPK